MSYEALFNKMQFEIGMLDRGPRPLELLDGHLLPKGTVTLIATDAGSGKSTSSIRAGASAAATGLWTMIGRKQHPEPLRVAILLGEDNNRSFESVLAGLPDDTKLHIRTGVNEKRLLISPFLSFAKTQEEGELFDVEGKPTDLGKSVMRAMREFKPDVIVLDTSTSLSACSYLDRQHAKHTINALNELADDTNSAILLMLHLTKTGSEKLTKESTANDMIRGVSGSAGLIASTRHALAFAPCPPGKFENVQMSDERDTLWMVGVKTNAIPDAAFKIFPVIRDYNERVLRTTDLDGVPLLQTDEGAEKKLQEELRAALPLAIRAAAELRSPFIQKASSKLSVQALAAGPLVDLLPKASASQITDALSQLERDGKIVPCTASRAGGSLVWDVPDGVFARETEYEQITGEKLTVRKGAPLFLELKERMEDLRAVDAETEMQAVEKKARAAEKEAQKGQVEEETGEVKAPAAEAKVTGVEPGSDALDAELMADLDNL